MSLDVDTPVFVLRRSFAKLQHGVLSVARSAGRLGIPVYAVQMHRREAATRSRYIRGLFELGSAVPFANASDEDWLAALLDLGSQIGRPLLVPIDDLSAVFVGDHRAELTERFLLPPQHDGLERRLAGRRALFDTCLALDIPVPDAAFPADEQAAVRDARRLGYPIVLKQSEPWLSDGRHGVPSVLIATSDEELTAGFCLMHSGLRSEVMLQEYIPGGSDAVWMFNGYFGEGSRCLCSFTGRKLRQRGPRTGPTTLGLCAHNPAVEDAARHLLGSLGYRGIVDMGFRYDERDGTHKLLDANPRLGSSFRLFVSDNGLDVLRAEYLDLTGQAVPRPIGPNGRKWIVEPHDLVVSAQLAHEKALTPRQWFRSLHGVQETAWWASDDPRPFLAMCAAVGLDIPDYVARRRVRKQLVARDRSTPKVLLKPGSG